MMLKICAQCLLVCCSVFLWITSAGAQDGNQRYVRADELRDHPGYCFDATRCSLRKTGQSWTVHKTCEKAICHQANNGTLVEKRTRCDSLAPIFSENCYIVRVEGKPFPDCCPRMICEDKPPAFTLRK